jgi:hypothetical protein
MPGSYAYVDGAHLTSLVLEVRDQFFARLPYELDDDRRPNSVRLVAVDVFDGKSTEEQFLVLRDLIDANHGLIVTRENPEIFAYSDTPAAYVADLVCEIVRQILGRDPVVQNEDQRRLALAAESAAELDEQWRKAARRAD